MTPYPISIGFSHGLVGLVATPQVLWDNNVLLSSIRLPLAGLAGVDLGDIESIALVFDRTDSGAIFVADLELLQ